MSVDLSHSGSEVSPVRVNETVDDIDLLIGHISQEFLSSLKSKVRKLVDGKRLRQGFDGKESR